MFGFAAEDGAGLTSASLMTARVAIIGILLVHCGLRNTTLEGAAGRIPMWLRTLLLASMLVLIAQTPSDDRAFLYFQF